LVAATCATSPTPAGATDSAPDVGNAKAAVMPTSSKPSRTSRASGGGLCLRRRSLHPIHPPTRVIAYYFLSAVEGRPVTLAPACTGSRHTAGRRGARHRRLRELGPSTIKAPRFTRRLDPQQLSPATWVSSRDVGADRGYLFH
jgi:hypothetical protein